MRVKGGCSASQRLKPRVSFCAQNNYRVLLATTHREVSIPNHQSIDLCSASSGDQLKHVGKLPDGEKRVREHSLCRYIDNA